MTIRKFCIGCELSYALSGSGAFITDAISTSPDSA